MTVNYLKICGGSHLSGDVNISGSKNASLALLSALALGEGNGFLNNVPDISDIHDMANILSVLGLKTRFNRGIFQLDGQMKNRKLPYELTSKIKASNYFLGVLLSKFGAADVSFAGGDDIGNRPLDIHYHVFNKFGIKTVIDNGFISSRATVFPYPGNEIFLRYPSVGATVNALLLAASATGESKLYNAAMEPEISNLAILLNQMGANIIGAGTPIIRILPAGKLKRVELSVIPDRIEAGTFMFFIAATRGTALIKNIIPEHLASVISILSDSGVKIKVSDNSLIINASDYEYRNMNIFAMPYPGMPTDLQPLASVFASTCTGDSPVTDIVFNERFKYLYELKKMGFKFNHTFNSATITGNQTLSGCSVSGNDIRMSASLILGALIATGETTIYNLKHLERGYENFTNKLSALGAVVFVESDDEYREA